MINILSRQIEIIEFLIQNNDYQPVKDISEYMKCSIKTVRNDLDLIEEFLSNDGISLEKKSGVGIKLCLSSEEKMKLNLMVNSNKNRSIGELSIEARRIKILSELLNNSDNTSIQKLSEKYYISKTSIVNDLRDIEGTLIPYNLKLERSQHGTRIIGNELDIRKAMVNLIDLLIEANDKLVNPSTSYRIDNVTLRELSKQFGEKDVIIVEKILKDTEKNLDYMIGEPYYINIVTHILILIKRIRGGNSLFQRYDRDRIESTDEKIYEVSNKMGELIESNFKINLPNEEIFFIYQYLVSSGVGFSSLKLETEKLLSIASQRNKDIAKEIIELCSNILQVDLNIDKQLYKNLILHLKPMMNRIKYKILIKNPLLDEIKREFHMVFDMVGLVMLIISEKFNLNYISEDEIAYLVLYFQTAMEQCMSQKRVIVVCSSGIGTSHLLKNRIKKSFPDWDIVDVVPLSCLESEIDLDSIDFILSTVKIKNVNKPIAYVTALFSDVDVKNVTELLLKDALKEERYDTTFETLKKFLNVNYINIMYETKYKNKENAGFLLEKMSGIKRSAADTEQDVFVAETHMSENFQVYLSKKNYTNNSCIGINIIDKHKSEVKIQVVISCCEGGRIMMNLIVELLQLFNNRDIIEKICKCKTSEQVINIFK